MALFETAHNLSMINEGGYSNDPKDPGGETYKGISRVHHPEWQGWGLIDELKKSSSFITTPVSMINTILERSHTIQAHVRTFYKIRYWDIYRLDEIPHQGLANVIYDMGINCGRDTAKMRVQLALNLSNNEGKRWPDIPVDGQWGPTSHNTLLLAVRENPNRILKAINVERGIKYRVLVGGLPEIRAHYDRLPQLKALVEGDSKLKKLVEGESWKECYYGGWLNRI
jgi:lysozyme family protein